jgi:hypothetical protein
MNLPRFSIAWIMAIIVIVAIDFAAFRALDGTSTLVGGLIAIGSIPMTGILMLGIPSLIKGLSRRGRLRPFLNGFEGVGWTILFVYTDGAILFALGIRNRIRLAFQLNPYPGPQGPSLRQQHPIRFFGLRKA